MSIHSHAACDQCERKLVPAGDEETVDERYLLDTGWVSVTFLEDGGEDENGEATKDFCSFLCASRWCVTATDSVTELESDDRAGT